MAWLVGLSLLILPGLEFWLLISLPFTLTAAIVQGCLTAAAGWWFSRGEGLDFWSELDSDLSNGRVPTEEGLDAMLVVAGGWALIAPGLLTDAAGAALLFPALRRRCIGPARALLRRYLIRKGRL